MLLVMRPSAGRPRTIPEMQQASAADDAAPFSAGIPGRKDDHVPPSILKGAKRKRSDSTASGSSSDEPTGAANVPKFSGWSKAGTIDELRAKLRSRIEELRTARKVDVTAGGLSNGAAGAGKRDKSAAAGVGGTKKGSAAPSPNRHKAPAPAAAAAAGKAEGDDGNRAAAGAPKSKRPRLESDKPVSKPAEDDVDFAFAGVTLARRAASVDGSVSTSGAEKRHKGKKARLTQMLRDAQQKQNKMARLESEGRGKEKAEQQFSTAMRRVEGDKVRVHVCFMAALLDRDISHCY